MRRRTLARHGELKNPTGFGSFFSVVGVALATVLVALVGVVAFNAFKLTNDFVANSVDIGGEIPPSIAEIEGGVNIFIAGTDQCEPQYAQYFGDRCADPDEEGIRSDVNMLVHISDEPRRVTVISFPRDLMVPIPACTDADGNETWEQSKAMLNSAYFSGGLACSVKTIEALTGVDIQYAASINWGGVIDITNAIGGVNVCIANGIYDTDTGIDWAAGERTVQGYEALQFLRTRHGVGNGGDLGRISNQQQYMSRLAKKILSPEVLGDPITVLRLATSAVSAIDPSTSLADPMTVAQIASAVKDVAFDDIVFVSYPNTVDPENPNRVVPIQESADALFLALAENKPIVLTGSAGDGVISVEQAKADEAAKAEAEANGETFEPTEPGETADPTETPDVTATPSVPSGHVALPSDVTGQTAASETCSAGNVRG